MFKELKKKLVADTKFKKYIIYALGEIILIVIGILVAMYLAEWKDRNNSIALAKTYIKEIHLDLRKDTAIFNKEIRDIDEIIKYKTMVLQKDSLNKMTPDQVLSILSVGYHNIKINSNSFFRMKESGVISLKEYEGLFKKLNSYYTFFNTYLENKNQWEVGLFGKDIEYWIYQDMVEIKLHDSIPVLQNEKARKENLLLMLGSPKGRNVVKMSLYREIAMKDTYTAIVEKTNKLLVIVDSLSLN